MHILEWIETVGEIQVFVHWAIEPAVIQGHVDVLKWVFQNGYKWDAKKEFQFASASLDEFMRPYIYFEYVFPMYLR